MPSFSTQLLQIALVWTAVLFIPGPDMTLLLRTMATDGKRPAMRLVTGICLALFIHLTIATTGLGALATKSPGFMRVVQILGGVYIGYLGLRAILAGFAGKASAHLSESQSSKQNLDSRLVAMKVGFLSTILNAKVTMFFLGMFAGVASVGFSIEKFALYCVAIIGQTWIFYFIFVAAMSSPRPAKFLRENANTIELVSGFVLLALGVRLAL